MTEPLQTSLVITPATKIGDLLDAYPTLEEVLIAQAPMFARLRNPVLRRTVARVTTVERAAGVASLDVRHLVGILREAVGQPTTDDAQEHDRADAPAPAADAAPDALPPWVEGADIAECIDADALLDAGTVPLGPVMAGARRLKPGEALRVDATFRPTPLIAQATRAGFPCHVCQLGPDRFATYIGPAPPEG